MMHFLAAKKNLALSMVHWSHHSVVDDNIFDFVPEARSVEADATSPFFPVFSFPVILPVDPFPSAAVVLSPLS